MWCTVSYVDARLDVNVALNRPSFQISTENDRTADRANDGNHNTHLDPYCMLTNSETNPWWAVDLGMALYVHSVKFTNRDDHFNFGK